ncbi:MAG: hypothetical protein ABJC39_10075 [Chloroflexota bacterium]
MSHPSLGLPPPGPTRGLPEAAARIRSNGERLASRALRVAMDADPTIETRYDEAGLRHLLHDAELLAERVALCLATLEPDLAREYAEFTAPVYRRRRTPMDDLVALCEGLRTAFLNVLSPGERGPASEALDAAIAVYRWHRRIAGDARKRNPLLQLLYKGG